MVPEWPCREGAAGDPVRLGPTLSGHWLYFLQSPWLRSRLRAEVDGSGGGCIGPCGGSEGVWDPEGGVLTPCWRKGT